MDLTDVLTLATTAAQILRNVADPAAALAAAYTALGLPPPSDSNDPLAVRIARLMDAAGDRRREVLDFLRTQTRITLLNRIPQGEGSGAEPAADPGAERLVQ